MESLRVGVIGAGANTRSKHIPLLQRINGVRIVAVCNRSLASSERVAREFAIPDAMSDWRALVEREDLDAVVIGTWPYMHAPMTIAALNADKHVLCEARMAMNAAEARAMLDASLKSDRVAQIVPSPRLFRSHAVLDEFVRSGALGAVREIVLKNFGDQALDPTKPAHWRQRRELSGLNAMTVGIDYEMTARYFGHARALYAQTKLWTAERPDQESRELRAVDVPESAHVIAEMESGARAAFLWSSVARAAESPRLEAYGTDGSLVVDLATERLFAALGDESTLRELPVPVERQGGWRVEQDFVDSIRFGSPVTLTSFADGVRYMEFTEAVHVSSALGRRALVSGASRLPSPDADK